MVGPAEHRSPPTPSRAGPLAMAALLVGLWAWSAGAADSEEAEAHYRAGRYDEAARLAAEESADFPRLERLDPREV